MTTHEIRYYIEHDSGAAPVRTAVHDNDTPADALHVAARYTDIQAKNYFNDNYVHPKAWRKVLEKYPRLKLCLAHFGGSEFSKGLGSSWVTEIIALTKEYPNVYTDIACWDIDECKDVLTELLISIEYAHLRKKLLFGTDWYMTLVALGGKPYKKFFEEAWDMFMEIPGGEELWGDCTFVNPFRFYGLFDKDKETGVRKLDNVVAALEKEECSSTALKRNLAFFNRLEEEYASKVK